MKIVCVWPCVCYFDKREHTRVTILDFRNMHEAMPQPNLFVVVVCLFVCLFLFKENLSLEKCHS